jgi:hypothetical protein
MKHGARHGESVRTADMELGDGKEEMNGVIGEWK